MSTIQADALVFYGATGDLAYKKIFPALHRMAKRGALSVPIIGVAKQGWTLEDLARSLSVSVPFLRLEIKRGRLHATHLGRRVVLLDSEVRRYLADSNGSAVPL